mmetsp:Transcript_27631/g.55559  ORF Transcript_27631/g.55559 Transcript_27631/m.55559 type:complete len:168 (-) Transcript_27631:534-1037(-)
MECGRLFLTTIVFRKATSRCSGIASFPILIAHALIEKQSSDEPPENETCFELTRPLLVTVFEKGFGNDTSPSLSKTFLPPSQGTESFQDELLTNGTNVAGMGAEHPTALESSGGLGGNVTWKTSVALLCIRMFNECEVTLETNAGLSIDTTFALPDIKTRTIIQIVG